MKFQLLTKIPWFMKYLFENAFNNMNYKIKNESKQ